MNKILSEIKLGLNRTVYFDGHIRQPLPNEYIQIMPFCYLDCEVINTINAMFGDIFCLYSSGCYNYIKVKNIEKLENFMTYCRLCGI